MERIQRTTEISNFQVEKATIIHDISKFSTLFQQHLSQHNTMESSFGGQSETMNPMSDAQENSSTYQDQSEIDATDSTNKSSSELSEVRTSLETEHVDKSNAEVVGEKVTQKAKSDLSEQELLANAELTEFVTRMPNETQENSTRVSHSKSNVASEETIKLAESSGMTYDFMPVVETQPVNEQSELLDESMGLPSSDEYSLEEIKGITETTQFIEEEQLAQQIAENAFKKSIHSSQMADDVAERDNLTAADNKVFSLNDEQQLSEKSTQLNESVDVMKGQSTEISSVSKEKQHMLSESAEGLQEIKAPVRIATKQVLVKDSKQSQLPEDTEEHIQAEQSVSEAKLAELKGSVISETEAVASVSSNVHKKTPESQSMVTEIVEGQTISQDVTPTIVHIDVPKLAQGNSETIEKVAETFAKPVVKELKSIVRPNEKVLTFDLAPDHLGKVQVKMKVTAQMVSLEFTVQSEQAKKALETITPSFDKVLQKQEQVPVFSITRTAEAPLAMSSENQSSQNFQQSFSQERHTPQQQRSSMKYKRPVEEITEPEIEARVSILA
uniref:flagellar hook-length control protein FliK n=1 Tax=Candidatus Enterococcus willemsii TaxID=1857215 RepID=UPI00403F0324